MERCVASRSIPRDLDFLLVRSKSIPGVIVLTFHLRVCLPPTQVHRQRNVPSVTSFLIARHFDLPLDASNRNWQVTRPKDHGELSMSIAYEKDSTDHSSWPQWDLISPVWPLMPWPKRVTWVIRKCIAPRISRILPMIVPRIDV